MQTRGGLSDATGHRLWRSERLKSHNKRVAFGQARKELATERHNAKHVRYVIAAGCETGLKAERERRIRVRKASEDEYRGLKRSGDVLVSYWPLARLDQSKVKLA